MQRQTNRLKIPLWTNFVFVIFLLSGLSVHINAAPPAPTEPTAANAHAFYLPLIRNGEAGKQWSGIHLGNIRTDARYEWHPATYWYLNPTVNQAAIWPAIIVVQSNQIYEIHRNTTAVGCSIQNASVRLPNAFAYLQAAAQAGSKVVIRITPSPGSFLSWAESPPSHRRMVVINPLGVLKTWIFNDATHEYNLADVPADFQEPSDCSQLGRYRSLRDIADEIKAIYDLNRSFGWTEYGFEPANEPNIEWFGADTLDINRTKAVAWDMMDLYFYYLMLRIKELQQATPTFQPSVFTPPMAQSQFEAGILLEYCQKDRYFVDDKNKLLPYPTGYERMRNAIEASDGFSWHSYWHQGDPFETYTDCNQATANGGHHISYHFPALLKTHLAATGKPLIISEADLLSPWQIPPRTPGIAAKDDQPTATATSLRNFLQLEHAGLAAAYPTSPALFALWLLNDNTSSLTDSPDDEQCIAGNCGLDHNWHEAYRDALEQLHTFSYSAAEIQRYGLPAGATYTINEVTVRAWFTQWWKGTEE